MTEYEKNESGQTLGTLGKTEPGRIVVTGASGFIGKNLCAALAKKGYRLRALVRNDKDDEFFKSLGAEVYVGDVRDEELVDRLMTGASGVFHLAGIVGRVGVLDKEYWDVHVTGTKRLLKSATKHGVLRFVHCSTAGVLGDVRNPPADESAAYAADDIYQITKSHGEKAAMASNGKKGLRVTVVRPTVVYGPGDMRVLRLFKRIASGKFRMIGSGQTLVHPIYIDDLVEGMILAYHSEKAQGNVYILGGPKYVTLNQWVEMIASETGAEISRTHIPYMPMKIVSFVCEKAFTAFGMEPPIFRRHVDFYIKNKAYSTERAERDFGFAPKVALAEGTRRTAAWYKEHGLL